MTDQTLESVAIVDVIVDINVRTDVKLDKSFVSSIRNHGILQPPIGWRGDDGKVRITAGQRRTLAAIEIGLEQLDVIIKPQEIAEAARIVTQLTENDQRQELTESERVHGYKQLAMFGVSADQIARKTNKPKQHVTSALAVAESPTATKALAASPIDLEQAAIIAEFDDDPEASQRLMAIAEERPSGIAHEAQRIRDRKAFVQAKAEAEQQLAGGGWEVLEGRPHWDDKTILSLQNLWREGGAAGDLNPEDVDDLEGRAVHVSEPGWSDTQAGSLVSVSYYIRGWRDQGLTTYSHLLKEDKSAANTAEAKAAKKAERQLNADLRSATTVRRTWIKESFLHERASFEIGTTLHLITAALLGTDTAASDARVYPIAAELLGIDYEVPAKGSYDNKSHGAVIDSYKAGTSPLRVALAVAIARTESVLGDPAGWVSYRDSEGSAAYYKQLEEWGYTLSDTERAIAYPKKGRRK